MRKVIQTEIFSADVLLARVLNFNLIEDRGFISSVSENFQLGFGVINDIPLSIPAHIHKKNTRVIDTTSEFIYVISGQLQCCILDNYSNEVQKVKLTSNMALLQLTGGHAFKILPGTKYFEIKQGPYLGKYADKEVFDDTCK
ncbi:hypothetical protein [Roseobacter sp. HKCCA2468]|uniref:hypothetical protein n=1 Tax=Roseobacter sp. HKCCA2468 TaxID=3120342 RepID=UPI0030ED5EF2